ncbi:hypothetical protein GXB85_04780 [Cellulomonas sp. APG4]|uniref:hypothetical protein n=1 Tax=Cellulomonas sp. APG4 TaxID=1538656 RepID=UPI00137A99BE|nr:hypothetical protein [Cellulomonas sp. APG4]NCT90269.1 hypothetical protein [Cellulomonas sp. APG4]
MDRSTHSSWLVTSPEPRPQKMLPEPRRAVARARTYGGDLVTAQVYAIARAPGFVCVEQEIPGRAPWNAWLPERAVTPV